MIPAFTRTLVEDPEHPGELLLDLGVDVCEHLGWKPGDTIEWKDNKDGTFTLTKALPNANND